MQLKNLTQTMDRTGHTPTDVARALGVKPGTVCAWMLGYRTPPLSRAMILAQVLGVTLEELIA